MKQSLLWKLTPPDRALTPSYLFGTMHVNDIKVFKGIDQITARLEQCEALALEFNLEDISSSVNPMPYLKPLDMLIPVKKFQKLRHVLLRTIDIDIQQMRFLSPMAMVNLINDQLFTQMMPVSLDQYLFDYAKSEHKEILGIESFQEQIAIMQHIPIDYQIKSLLWIGSHFSQHRKGLYKMIDWYQKGDLRQLYRSAKGNAHELRPLLLYHRNAIMAERIGGMIREKTIFCAIGAGHLPGEKGVLRLLKKQGIKIKAINYYK
ncbi:MAG TPA: TraB/GumN family protein [Saprospiraceae bacterium]|nr:TraB/GumN family protein [Saprospiraceae bacterium]HMQ82580.1 TraB/GumN family protein [Saprospiraceae bacterium]